MYLGCLGVWKVRGTIIRVEWTEFQIMWSRETFEHPPKSFVRFSALLTRLRCFFFVPWSPSLFFEKSKKNARRQMIEMSVSMF